MRSTRSTRSTRSSINDSLIIMPPKKITLTDIQKYELCLHAQNNKKNRTQYVDWVEQKWGVRVNESTITRVPISFSIYRTERSVIGFGR